MKNRNALPDKEKIKLRWASLCAVSEQCEYDLRLKGRRAGISAEDIEEILSFLRQNKFLDEARFARAFANDKVRFAGWGFNKIRMALKAKRISDIVISTAIESVDRKDYIDALKKVGNVKARSLDLSLPSDKNKFIRHMLSKGFEIDLVMKMCDWIERKTKG